LFKFDLRRLGALKQFDVVIVDPAWQINYTSLPYQTIEDEELTSGLQGVRHLQSKGGLIFLWVTGRTLDIGIDCLEQWGYTFVENIVWVKVN
jgi:mRNA m6A methyltransferase catalytic subunit